MITQKIDLNLIPGRVLPRVNVSQYDKGTRTLEFTIYNGDVSFDPTSYTAYIQGFKPDGHGFNYPATITSQKITADVTEQMTAVYGEVTCEVIIMDGTDRIGTGNFILNVERAAMPDDAQMSDSDYAYIEQLIEDAQQAVEDAQAEVENAEAWANGTRDGQAIPATDPAYNKNSKYWSEQSSDYSEDAEAWANGTRDGQTIPSTDTAYHKNSKYWSEQSASYVEDAEAWAVGTRNGTPVPSGSPEYENNAAYWANEARNVAQQTTYTEMDDSLALAPTSAGNALPLTIYGQSTQNGTPTPSAPVAIDSASADFKCVGKNLLPYPYYQTTRTAGGITFTDNGDGSITVSGGVASADVAFGFHARTQGEINDFVLANGNYILSGCPSGGTANTYYLYLNITKNGASLSLANDFGSGASFTANGDDFSNDSINPAVYFQVMSGADFTTPMTVKPMLRLASVADATYEPYKKTNVTTYSVGSNLITNTATSQEINNVTFTVNADGSISTSGTSTADFSTYIIGTVNGLVVGKRYIVSSDTDGAPGKYYMRLHGSSTNVYQYNEPYEFVAEESDYEINLRIYNGTNMNGVTFKPEVRLVNHLTLRSIEVTSADPYNLVKDGHYYIADTIDWDEVDGYTLTKRIQEFTVNGTEDWNYNQAAGQERFDITIDKLNIPRNKYNGKGMSDHFYCNITGNSGAWGSFRISNGVTQFVIVTNNDLVMASLSDFLTWLGNNNTTFMYILETPTKTPLTSAQAKALLSMRTYDESTSIDAVNAPAPVLELEYAKTRTPALALTGHNMAHINAIDIGDM